MNISFSKIRYEKRKILICIICGRSSSSHSTCLLCERDSVEKWREKAIFFMKLIMNESASYNEYYELPDGNFVTRKEAFPFVFDSRGYPRPLTLEELHYRHRIKHHPRYINLGLWQYGFAGFGPVFVTPSFFDLKIGFYREFGNSLYEHSSINLSVEEISIYE